MSVFPPSAAFSLHSLCSNIHQQLRSSTQLHFQPFCSASSRRSVYLRFHPLCNHPSVCQRWAEWDQPVILHVLTLLHLDLETCVGSDWRLGTSVAASVTSSDVTPTGSQESRQEVRHTVRDTSVGLSSLVVLIGHQNPILDPTVTVWVRRNVCAGWFGSDLFGGCALLSPSSFVNQRIGLDSAVP